MPVVPVIDSEKCDGCGTCVDACPVNVLEVKNKKCVVVNPDECIECQACEATCEKGAISFP